MVNVRDSANGRYIEPVSKLGDFLMTDNQELCEQLDRLMESFAQLPEAEIGYGPKHPSQPNAAIEADLVAFLEEHSFLRRDAGYIRFMERYCGAAAYARTHNVFVDISGLAGVSVDVVGTPAPFVDDEGFAGFAAVEKTYYQATGANSRRYAYFSFDATGTRKHGVYRMLGSDMTAETTPWEWHSSCFLEWLERTIQSRGQIEE
jgi:hypothetical protein